VKKRELIGRTYARMFARPGKAQAVNHALYHLALRGMGYNNGWEPDRSGEEWFIKNVLAPSDLVTAYDVGANVGEYSKLLLKHTGMNVLAFEPLPEAFKRLENLPSSRFEALQIALGRVDAIQMLHFGDNLTEHATLSDEAQRIDYVGAGNYRSQEVMVRTLDSFLGGLGITPPDFLKIDVEGVEYDVLLGAPLLLRHFPPKCIQIEWNLHQLMTGHTLLHFADLLGKRYTAYQLLPRGLRKVNPERPEASTFCYGNFVFIHDEASVAGIRIP
jgi:FkbM family methyltransferase